MVWSRHALVLLCGLGLACGPSGEQSPDTDSEGETESEGESGSTGGTNPTTTTSTTTPGTSTTTTTTGPEPTTTTTGPDPDTATSEPPPPPTDTGECPYGTEGCLCDVGSTCDEGLMCVDGTCVAPPPCEPIDTDPHGDEASAITLDPLNCGEGVGVAPLGTIVGPETDWYTFDGNDAFGCPERPGALVTSGETLQVCVYLECQGGGNLANVNCDVGNDAMSPDGQTGCCGDDAARVGGYDCFGGVAGKNATIWISVGSDQEICADYDMEYSF